MEPKKSIWSRIFWRPKEGFRGDVMGALLVLAGAALGAWVLDDFDGLVGAAIGAAIVVIYSAVRRGVKRRRAPGPLG